MARQQDITTVFINKTKALRVAGGGGAAVDATTALRKYLDLEIADSTSDSVNRADLNTRVYIDATTP